MKHGLNTEEEKTRRGEEERNRIQFFIRVSSVFHPWLTGTKKMSESGTSFAPLSERVLGAEVSCHGQAFTRRRPLGTPSAAAAAPQAAPLPLPGPQASGRPQGAY